MINKNEFIQSVNYKYLTNKVKEITFLLDDMLTDRDFKYKAVWRKDKELGGNVFVFEVVNRKGRRKNLITLRPQIQELKVEVYWSEYDKHYFNLRDPKVFPDGMIEEIMQMYNLISD